MIVDRRGFFRVGLGGAATMVLAAAEPLLRPTAAYAITVVDDAVVGALVLAMMSLAGYAVASTLTSTTLAAMGYSFSEFAQDLNNQSAAVTRAIADANNLGVTVNRQNAEQAAAAIAAGTGAFAGWMADAAATGKATIDGWLGGIGANQAALWGLVSEFAESVLSSYATVSPSATFVSQGQTTIGSCGVPFRCATMAEILEPLGGRTLPITPTWAVGQTKLTGLYNNYRVTFGNARPVYFNKSGNDLMMFKPDTCYVAYYSASQGTFSTQQETRSNWMVANEGYPILSPEVFNGISLPGVDRAADAPETLGAGYDKTPIGADAVVGQDGTITNSGSIALPVGVSLPGVDTPPYSQGLYGLDAGVVSGLSSVPYSAGLTDAWVGTPEGVVSMPISQAMATSTSLSAAVAPSEPVVPPDTPDVGPWQPAYDLPFYDVWPFNLVYTFVEQISALGGAS